MPLYEQDTATGPTNIKFIIAFKYNNLFVTDTFTYVFTGECK